MILEVQAFDLDARAALFQPHRRPAAVQFYQPLGISNPFVFGDEPGLRRDPPAQKELRALTPEEFERARQRLMNPAPGSRIEAAAKYGIDLTLLVEQLRLTPAERAANLQRAAQGLKQVRGIASKRK